MVALVQSVTGTTAPGNPSSASVTLNGVASGDALIFVANYTNGADTLPTDSAGQTWTKLVLSHGPATNATLEIWYLLNANAGTHALTWAPGTSCYNMWSLMEFVPLSAVDVTGTAATASGNAATSITATQTSTNASDLLLAVFSAYDSTGIANMGISTPSGMTSVFTYNASNTSEAGNISYQQLSSSGAQSATWNFTAGTDAAEDYVAILVSFKISAASGPSLMGHGIFVNA